MRSVRNIKRHTILIALLLVFSLTPLFAARKTSAACSALPTSMGTNTFTINVPADGTYRFWAHTYNPTSSNDAFYLQVDQLYCQITVGNTNSLQSGQFTWIDYQNGATNNKINLSLSAGNHTFTLAGLDPSVGIDKVILAADQNCVPTVDGTNCTNVSSTPGTIVTAPPGSSSDTPAVTGTISLPGASNGGTVTYYLNGKPINGTQLDTTKLPDGVYTLKRVEVNADGTSKETTQQIVVDNHKTIAERAQKALKNPLFWVLFVCIIAAILYILVRRVKPEWIVRSREWVRQHVFHKRLAPSQPAPQGIVVYTSPNNPIKHPFWKKLFVIGFALVGTATLLHSFAATTSVGYHTWQGTTANGANVVSKSEAIGGKMVQFAAAAPTPPPPSPSPTPTPSPTPPSASFPARWSVGAPGVGQYTQATQSLPVPSGYTVLNPSDGSSKAYNLYNCSGTTTLDHVYVKAFIYVGTNCHGTLNITNSIIAPPSGSNQRAILVNADNSAALTINISDTTIRPEPVPLGGTNDALTDHVMNGCETCTINMNRMDVANSGGMCLCGRNVTIQNSWLHDNYIAHLADPSVAHTGGVFPYADSGPVTIRNNRLEPGYNVGTGQPVTNYWQAITAVLFTQSSGGSVLRNYTVDGNFISLGAFDMGLEDGQDLIIKNNIFGPNHWGYTTTCSSGCSVSIADWSNNKVGDIDGNPGATLPKPF